MALATVQPARPAASRGASALALASSVATGALSGALAGLLVGGVLGRLAMRLLAVTSPAAAQGRLTDDQAIVGQVTLGGSLFLAFATTAIGAVGGLLYLWVRRVLPTSRVGRCAGFGLFAGAIGGALFVHDYPSFDYTVLSPAWLAVALFVMLPATFGVVVALLVETFEPRADRLPRPAAWLVMAGAAAVAAPTLPLTAPVIALAFVVALVPMLRTLWRSRFVTLVGSGLFVLMVAWGGYGLVVDGVSLATGVPASAPLNP